MTKLLSGFVFQRPTVCVNAHCGVCVLLLRICCVLILWWRSVLSPQRWQHILSQSATERSGQKAKLQGEKTVREESGCRRRGWAYRDSLLN